MCGGEEGLKLIELSGDFVASSKSGLQYHGLDIKRDFNLPTAKLGTNYLQSLS